MVMFIPGTVLSSSAKLFEGVLWIASEVMTDTVAGALTICCSTFEALTTKVEQALVKFANARDEILSLFGLGPKAA